MNIPNRIFREGLNDSASLHREGVHAGCHLNHVSYSQ